MAQLLPPLTGSIPRALLGVAILSLWAARGALVASARKNRALWIFLGGFLTLVTWGWAAGLSWGQSLVYFLIFLLSVVGCMRLRLDGGLPVVGLFFMTGNFFFFIAGTGAGVFSPAAYVAIAFLSVLSYTSVASLAWVQFEGLKMAAVLDVGSPRLVLVLILGMVLGILAGYWSMLELVYQHGIFALDQQGAARSVARVGRYLHYLYAEAGTQVGGTDWCRLGAMVFGVLTAENCPFYG